jgi:cAMP-binding proteins - catabolite gene activator and regulatory subunit of cAMP-dependent protein kinases
MSSEPIREPSGGEPPHANRLLANLPEDVYASLAPQLERHSFDRGKRLHLAGETITDLYFPLDCLISVTVTMHDRRTAETGVVGSREMVGINAFMGGRETTQTEYVIQIAGDCIRMPAAPLLEAFDRDKRVRDLLLKYTQAMLAQVTQNAACNGLHSMEQRYARWLLESRDRVRSDDLRLTHEFIAEMLGVRRAGITELANKFVKSGILEAKRGWTMIADGPRLEKASCECYAVLRDEYNRLLGPAAPWIEKKLDLAYSGSEHEVHGSK